MAPLDMRPDLARRLVWEIEAVRACFGARLRLAVDERGRPCWRGSVPVEGQPFAVIVTYSQAYPAEPPVLETTAPIPANCPHVLGRGDRHLVDALAREQKRPVVYAGVYGGGWGAEVIFSDAGQDTPCYTCAARALGHGGIEQEERSRPAYALPAAAPSTAWVRADLTSIMPIAALAARVLLTRLADLRGFHSPWREFGKDGASAWRLALRHVPAWGTGPWALEPVKVVRLPDCPVCGAGRRDVPPPEGLFTEQAQ